MNIENNTADINSASHLPSLETGAVFTKEDLADDMEGLQLFIPRVKIPHGSLQFELPGDDPENPNCVKSIEGVILYHHAANAYWPESDDEEETIPLCSSSDGKQGVGEPGGLCAICAMNQFGTSANGRGKACKNMRVLYVQPIGAEIPLIINLSPTSIKGFSVFYTSAFVNRRRTAYGSIVSFGLKRQANGKDEFSVVTFKKIADLEGEELAEAKMTAVSFKERIKLLNQQRATETAAKSDEAIGNYGAEGNVVDAGDRFEISGSDGYFAGDLEKLPA